MLVYDFYKLIVNIKIVIIIVIKLILNELKKKKSILNSKV